MPQELSLLYVFGQAYSFMSMIRWEFIESQNVLFRNNCLGSGVITCQAYVKYQAPVF